MSSDGAVLSAQCEPSRGAPDPVARVMALVGRLVAEASARAIRLDGIGIGLPGLVDVEKGMMIDTANPRAAERLGLSRQSLQQMLRRRS